MKVVIEKMGINGEGIGYIQKRPVFVPGALLKEVVDINVVESFKTYSIGKLMRVYEESPNRVEPVCPMQRRCGACPLMICKYEEQLNIKRDVLKQSLIKYAQVDPRLIKHVIPCKRTLNYRNQCKVPFSMVDRELVTGMYQPNSNYFTEVEDCPIHEKGLERVRKAILKVLNKYYCRSYDYHQKRGYRTLVIRGMGDRYQVTLVTGLDEIAPAVVADLMAIEGVVSLYQSVHTQKKGVDIFGPKVTLLAGERYLDFEFMGLKLALSPRSFFQLNTQQAARLYQKAIELLDNHYGLIVEAYSGIGGISLALKDKADEIIGIENVKDAVVNANANARANGTKHVSFICDDAANKLVYLSKTRNIDLLVVDPPRSGLDDNMLDCILRGKIKQILYISCNPATLGKNLSVLRQRYDVKVVQPVDLFPNSQHIESIVLLQRKSSKRSEY